jgi:hypothetical protein
VTRMCFIHSANKCEATPLKDYTRFDSDVVELGKGSGVKLKIDRCRREP